MVSQMFPGATPGESFTIQNFLRFEPPEEQDQTELDEYMAFMGHVVGNEDYYTGFHVQKALAHRRQGVLPLRRATKAAASSSTSGSTPSSTPKTPTLPALLDKGVR